MTLLIGFVGTVFLFGFVGIFGKVAEIVVDRYRAGRLPKKEGE